MNTVEAGGPDWLNLIKDLSAATVSLSLLLGVSWLIGICSALGTQAFGYLNATDIARSALTVCPLLALYYAVMHMVRLAVPAVSILDPTPRPGGVPAQRRDLKRAVVFALALLTPMYLLLTERFFVALAPLPLVFVVLMLADHSYELRLSGAIGAMPRLVTLVVILCLMVAGLAFYKTSLQLMLQKTDPQEVVCIAAGCREATIISRFSEATFIQWAGEADIVVLPNGEIQSVTLNRNYDAAPIVDLRPQLSALWRWLNSRLAV